MLLHVFVRLSFIFSLFCSVSDGKSCFSIKKFILTSKRHAEHLFAGQNTQHTGLTLDLWGHLMTFRCLKKKNWPHVKVWKSLANLATKQVTIVSSGANLTSTRCGLDGHPQGVSMRQLPSCFKKVRILSGCPLRCFENFLQSFPPPISLQKFSPPPWKNPVVAHDGLRWTYKLI